MLHSYILVIVLSCCEKSRQRDHKAAWLKTLARFGSQAGARQQLARSKRRNGGIKGEGGERDSRTVGQWRAVVHHVHHKAAARQEAPMLVTQGVRRRARSSEPRSAIQPKLVATDDGRTTRAHGGDRSQEEGGGPHGPSPRQSRAFSPLAPRLAQWLRTHDKEQTKTEEEKTLERSKGRKGRAQ